MNLKRKIAYVLLLFSLSSCVITERLLINEDNSGTITYEMDGSSMMTMLEEKMGKPEDTFKKRKKKSKKEKDASSAKVIDSTFSLKELYAEKQDSIAKLSKEEQEQIKKMENFKIRMIIDEENKIMKYILFADFKSMDELQNMTSPINTFKSIGAGGSEELTKNNQLTNDALTTFSYDGKIFKKTVQKSNFKEDFKEALKKENSTDEDIDVEEIAEGVDESMNMIFEQSSYTIIYQFPKPIKSVSVENAVISDDRKTVTIPYQMKDYMSNPESLNFEINFE